MTARFAITLIVSTFLLIPGAANAGCPQGKERYVGKVVRVHYANESYSPTFVYDGFENEWITLSSEQGLNTEYGRAMLAVLLTGLSLDMFVQIRGCKDGKVNEITIQNSQSD